MRKQNSLSRMLGLASLLGVMALAACGGSSGTKEDMTTPKAPDMTATGGTNCAAILTCVLTNCSTDATCIGNCIMAGSTTAQNTFNAIEACGLNACTVATDGGSDADGGGPACSSVMDTSPACVACASAAAQGGGCTQYIAACENS